jgi:hypothetical protein
MPDTQIHPTGVVVAPGAFIIPSSAELGLKAVFASFDGSGAAGDFLPLLRVKSDAGSVVAEAVVDTTVAAGASADVTWFPGVKAVVSGGSGGAALQNKAAIYSSSTSFSLAAGVPTKVDWSLDAGDVLLDLSDPFNPEILTTGLYCFSVAYGGSGFPAGASLEGELTFQATTALGVGTSVPRGTNTADHYGFTGMTRYLAANTIVTLVLTNLDTATRHGFIHQAFVSLLAT